MLFFFLLFLHVQYCPICNHRAAAVHSPDPCQGLLESGLRRGRSVMTEDGVGKIGASTRRPRGWEVRGRSGRPASALNGGGDWTRLRHNAASMTRNTDIKVRSEKSQAPVWRTDRETSQRHTSALNVSE